MLETQMTTEDWKHHRQDQQERREKRLPIRVAQLYDLKNVGYEVRKLSEYQFRITKDSSNIKLDIYPIHLRYHNINNGKRGSIYHPGSLLKFVNNIFSDEPSYVNKGLCVCCVDTTEIKRLIWFAKLGTYYFEKLNKQKIQVFQDIQKTRPVTINEYEFLKYFKVINKEGN